MNGNQIQTVTGIISKNDLGFVLPHEHLLCNLTSLFIEPTDPWERALAYKTVTLENLAWVRVHRLSNLDNLYFYDKETIIQEVVRFRERGGSTIVELTPNNVGRDPVGLAQIAKATGINVVMGTSYYTEQSYYPELAMDSKTEKDIAKEFVEDVTQGVNGVKAGIIGEIGCSSPLTKNETKVLRAAATAQQETGAAITIHPGTNQDSPFEIIDILEHAGADISRVVIGHITRAFPSFDNVARERLASTGCYLEYDLFGYEGLLPFFTPHNMAGNLVRVEQIAELVAKGFSSQILISHDICHKVALYQYGGCGYSHILDVVIPAMIKNGISEKEVNTITRENPKRVLTLV